MVNVEGLVIYAVIVYDIQLLLVQKIELFFAYCELSNIFTKPIHFFTSRGLRIVISGVG